MSKRRISFSIADEELEEALTGLLKDRIEDICMDSVKAIVSEVLTDSLKERMGEKAERAVNSQMTDYYLRDMAKGVVRDKVSGLITDWSGDINNKVRRMVDDAVKEQLERGRMKAFVQKAVENEIQNYTARIFADFKNAKNEQDA